MNLKASTRDHQEEECKIKREQIMREGVVECTEGDKQAYIYIDIYIDGERERETS